MWELLTRKMPFGEAEAFTIPVLVTKGKRFDYLFFISLSTTRPTIPKKSNKDYVKLIEKCWNQKVRFFIWPPLRRPLLIVWRLTNEWHSIKWSRNWLSFTRHCCRRIRPSRAALRTSWVRVALESLLKNWMALMPKRKAGMIQPYSRPNYDYWRACPSAIARLVFSLDWSVACVWPSPLSSLWCVGSSLAEIFIPFVGIKNLDRYVWEQRGGSYSVISGNQAGGPHLNSRPPLFARTRSQSFLPVPLSLVHLHFSILFRPF